jgi:hypothetical protein
MATEVSMRKYLHKYLGLASAVAAIALGAAIWAKSGAVVTTDGIARSQTGISPYEMMSNVRDLPVQQIEGYY